MNRNISINQSFIYQCLERYPSFTMSEVAGVVDCLFVPLQCWILWLGIRGMKTNGSIAPSDVLTMTLAMSELVSCFSFSFIFFACVFKNQYMIYFGLSLSGTPLVGRPLLKSLICVERYVAVAYPVYIRHSSSRQRYVVLGMVWLLSLCFGGINIYIFPEFPTVLFTSLLMVDLLIITCCSMAMLKALVRPGPGEKQNKEMQHKKRRVFIVITTILVVFIFAYSPYVIMFSIKDYLSTNTFCIVFGISLWFFKPSGIIQPFLYLFKIGKLPCIKKA